MFQANRFLEQLVQSFNEQTLSKDLFEVILVFNGPSDGSWQKLKRLDPVFNYRVAHVGVASAGAARNVGIALASKGFITFVDADDTIESDYLRAMFDKSNNASIVVAPILDRRSDGTISDSNYTSRHSELAGREANLNDVGWILGFNSCKSVPSRFAKLLRYDPNLKSGEDVAFFAGLLQFSGLKVRFLENGCNRNYLRSVTEGSVSRQTDSLDFSVRQRLAVIHALSKIEAAEENRQVILSLQRAQFDFVERFILKNKNERHEAIDLLREERTPVADWERLNRGQASALVFSYCFPPYADASGTIVAKRILENRRIVDVISAKMDSVRTQDPTLLEQVRPWIEKHHKLDVPISFASWVGVSEYAREAKRVADAWNSSNYDFVYSRAMWAGSHLAALLYKIDNPDLPWVAEFSDPMTLDAGANKRASDEIGDSFARKLWQRCFPEGDVPMPKNLFEFVETATFKMADRLVFTNRFQKELMVGGHPQFPSDVLRKVEISPHPAPPSFLYEVEEPSYVLDPDFLNIGYFGNFYPNRGLGELLNALEHLPMETRKNVRFHVFTSSLDASVEELPRELREMLVINPTLHYLRFLAQLNEFDVLLVTDAATKGVFDNNPFLPSKYSDYRGSRTPVWGHVETGSILSEQSLNWKSFIGDPTSILEALMAMQEAKG